MIESTPSMMTLPPDGLVITRLEVLPEWLDYNGHMNVAYYIAAFDTAIEDLNDIGMVQSGDRLRLLVESLTHIRFRQQFGPNAFDSDGPIEFAVMRLVNHPHATPTDAPYDLVAAADLLAHRMLGLTALNRSEPGRHFRRVHWSPRHSGGGTRDSAMLGRIIRVHGDY